MRNRTVVTLAIHAFLAAMLFFEAPSRAGAPVQELARVSLLASEVALEPIVDAAGWRLVVSGPETIHFSKEGGEAAPSISLQDLERAAGAVLDGLYVYELILPAATPTAEESPVTGPAVEAPRPKTPERRRVQFGSFSVLNGAILVPEESATGTDSGVAEPDIPRNELIMESLAVQGTLCAGSASCTEADGSFFQIIRIKGDNTRLEFTDTSTIVNFPTNDWELTANGSSVGTPEFFAITDAETANQIVYIEAGAPTNSLYVEDDGDVGLGTASPATTLHVAGAATIDGDLSVLSSRATKDDLAAISPEEILNGLERLSILTWRYRDDPRDARHLGPTAEDFHAIFGIGVDPRHLSPSDAAGVALASAQQLQRLVRELQLDLAEMRTERDELSSRVAELEARLPANAAGE